MLGSLQFGYNTGVINAPQKVRAEQQQDSTCADPGMAECTEQSVCGKMGGGLLKEALASKHLLPTSPLHHEPG